MKKLMIAAAIVCAAVMAQASTIEWGSGGVLISGDFSDPVVADNFAIYLFSADTLISTDPDVKLTSSYLVDQLKGGKYDGLSYSLGHDVIASGEVYPSSVPSSVGPGDFVNYFALLFDNEDAMKAGYVFATQVYSEKMPDAGTLNADWDGETVILALDYATKENWTKIGAVPEPTSGLLLLLGVAGLALRRRRA